MNIHFSQKQFFINSQIKKKLKKKSSENYNIKFQLLDSINNYKLSQFNDNSKNVALMLESRIFENTEFILRNQWKK